MILGVFFLLLGISILLKALFHIDLPIVRVGMALVLVYLGVRVLTGGNWRGEWHSDGKKGDHSVFFSSEDTRYQPGPNGSDPSPEYNFIFGSGQVDLTQVALKDQNISVEVNTVFGKTEVFVKEGTPVLIRGNAAFGEARMPNEDMVAVGTLNYRSPGFDSSKPHLVVRGNAVFGSIRFFTRVSASN